VTNRGNEYQGAFDKVYTKKGIRHTRTRPRHRFVERLQGIILSELWRIEFRRRLFTGASTMQTALDRNLDFYNHRRSHHGYRTQVRTAGEIFCIRGGKRDKRQRH
jgi:hypothetical protein